MKRLNDPANRVIVAVGVVVVLLAVVLVVPRLLYPPLPASRFAGVAPDRRIELENDRLKLQNDARATLAQILAGGILLLGAYLTWRQLQVNREGQITDRYTRAIDQLGHDQLDVRLGGIYALERIARDSPSDRATIGEVLTTFVRGHAPWPPRLPGQYVATAPIDEVPELEVRAADVQACLTVLGRGFAPPAEGPGDLDLHAVDLRKANLRYAHLERVTFLYAHLEGAELSNAHLEDANFNLAHLEHATFTHANMEGTSFYMAHLEGAWFGGANLQEATLHDAHLEGATLLSANLRGAILLDAHLEGANLHNARLEGMYLVDAHLEGAEANEQTSWPAGFDWRAAGVIVEGEDAAASPPQQT
jgi:Pentapeptide repeats (9 copies)